MGEVIAFPRKVEKPKPISLKDMIKYGLNEARRLQAEKLKNDR
jgi:hypothetical protein